MYRIRQVKVKVEEDDINHLLSKVAKKVNINKDKILDYKIVKKSIDARNKNEIYFVYELDIKTNEKVKLNNDIIISPNEEYVFPEAGSNSLENKIVVDYPEARIYYLGHRNNYSGKERFDTVNIYELHI